MKSIILYTTRYGCTAEVAKRIQKAIGDDCMICNIMIEDAPSLDQFDTVILGGSVYIGKIQKKLTSYMDANLSQLLTKKIGIYICAGAKTPEDRDKELADVFPAELFAHAVVKNVLGYAFCFEKMKFLDRFIMKKVKGDAVSITEYDDKSILQFAKSLKTVKV